MRRETREKMDQADIKMENRWKVSPPKRKQKKNLLAPKLIPSINTRY
jgi:hypothetical protein